MPHRTLTSYIAIYILFAAFPYAARAESTNTLSLIGIVKNVRSTAVSGLQLTFTNLAQPEAPPFTSVTGKNGVFRLSGISRGSYRVTAKAKDSSELDLTVDVVPQEGASGNVIDAGTLLLGPAPGTGSDQPTGKLADVVREEITVTARRVEESAQSVPIPVSVLGGRAIEESGAFNVTRLKELVPSVQFYSSNPRNSAINIRGLGSPFGLTNDGIEPGVGFYVDGVFYARPAAATLDFLDLERIEVLRGPQGTLFGKNTTSGAIHITTRRPTFTPESTVEVTLGNIGFLQAKGSISGPLTRKLAGRLSFSGTQRDGMLQNVRTGDDVNDLNNQGIRGQLLFIPTDKLTILAAADYTRQRPNGYAQVVAGVAPTLRPLNRQWAQMARDLGYAPPSYNAFDRQVDTDTPWRSDQDMGGASVTIDWNRGPGTLTSITAWRYWDWRPSNDRDFVGLPITTASAAPSIQHQWTQEVRYAAAINSRVNFVAGAFLFGQKLDTSPFHKQEQGAAAARFLLAPSALAATPGLLDGYGQNIQFKFNTWSAAGFGQVEFYLTRRWRLTPGLRYNYDSKDLDYDQTVYGGLQTTDPALVALKRSILSPLRYQANVADHNVSGQVTLAYQLAESAHVYGTYATGFKSIGLNLGGVPTDAAGNPITSAALVRPEDVRNLEIGLKTKPFRGVTANISAFQTAVRDYQTQVVNAQVGVLRGYLANDEKVRVRGIEFDGTAKAGENTTFYASAAFTDGRYLAFRDAPPPLEDTGGPQAKDISGSILPGLSKWAGSFGGEYSRPVQWFGRSGEAFAAADISFRSNFSSSPSYSRYLVADGYALVNPRMGFRSPRDKWSVTIWARNLTGSNYFELLSAAPGNSGLYVGLPSDRRTFGITLRRTFGGPGQGADNDQSLPAPTKNRTKP
jgi:iron complex outermembrane recepter protein